jgi:hypothetical protein
LSTLSWSFTWWVVSIALKLCLNQERSNDVFYYQNAFSMWCSNWISLHFGLSYQPPFEKIKSWSKLLSIILLFKKSKGNPESKHSTSKQENKDCTMKAPYWTCLALLSVLLLCPIHWLLLLQTE